MVSAREQQLESHLKRPDTTHRANTARRSDASMSRQKLNTPVERPHLDLPTADAMPFAEVLWRHAPLGLAVLDRNCRYVRINEWLAELQGASVAAHIGRLPREMVPAIAALVTVHVEAVLKSGHVSSHPSVRELVPGRSLNFSYYPIASEGHPLAVGLLVQEAMTSPEIERQLASDRQAREHAEQANRMKDEFLANLGHELRTPLNAIVGWAHMLQKGQLGPIERNRAVDTIVRNAKSQATLVDDLLDVSRIMSGKLRLNVERVALGPVLEAAVEGARPAAGTKDISLTLEVPPNLGEVMGDAHRLQQIVWNLISNAIKFTQRKGAVVVRGQRFGEWLRVQVIDDGQGIRPEFLPFLFQRFRQADASSARRHGGLGLGLAIVRQLVELHAGSVEAFSDGQNRGSTFTIALPAAPPVDPELVPSTHAAQVQPIAHAPAPVGVLVGACILVVDDEADARELLAALLTREGAEVLTAASGAQALQVLRLRIPDVLVCDIGMPEQDGHSFLRQLRTLGEGAGGWVPAVAVTGYATPKDSSEALLSGFQFHVSKPIDPPHVLACIVKLWRRGMRDTER